MNVLILTPDAVGSTLLQRLITIYMQFHQYDQPVINLHELTNGLVKYYNPTFDQDVLGKKNESWGYHQSLEQIVELLSSVTHYKTSRLAHYHIRNRQDTIADQKSFYQYLNDNFYIISCRRHNIFEHSLSWCLSKITKKLNVYSDVEKIDSFFELYRDGIDLDPNSLIQTLNAYRDYITWCNNHFNVASYFYYEEHLPKIEQYILNLPIFSQQPEKITWQDNFGINFYTWNCYHYMKSDLGSLALNQPEKFAQLANNSKTTLLTGNTEFLNGYRDIADPSWPAISSLEDYRNLPKHIRYEAEQKHGLIPLGGTEIINRVDLSQSLVALLPDNYQNFLKQYCQPYQETSNEIKKMIDAGIMVGPPPIKKQILAEKKHIIRNYQNLLTVYNQWVEKNPDIGNPLTDNILDQFADLEKKQWNPVNLALAVSAE